jgi:hypothetical protein
MSRVKHGEYMNGVESPEHYIWRAMLRRKKARHGKYYENVNVCERWYKFENFLADVGRRPSPMHSIDRYPDPRGDYEPSNIRWATRKEQALNRTTTKRWSQGATTATLTEWANILGISTQLAYWRMKNLGTFVKGQTWQQLQRLN